jgi:LDH2 family malate/lactate/ureidoglycolate dehydrogenase
MSGEKIPPGWIVDKDGHDTDNPLDFSSPTGVVGKNGRLLSFGGRDGHKGYCLSILMEILGGILPGAGSIVDKDVHLHENGLLCIVLDPQRFAPLETFKGRVDSLFKKVHAEPVESGFQYDEVQVPGEFEWRNREERLKDGIEVSKVAWEQIVSLAEELDIRV